MRLRALLDEAAHGRFPPADGRVDVLPAPDGCAGLVIAFTGHFYVAADVEPAEVARRCPDGDLSAPMSAPFLTWLASQLGSRPGTMDALLCALGRGAGVPAWLQERTPDQLDHARVDRATRYRADARIYTTKDDAAVVVIGRSIAGRWEFGYEVAPDARGAGIGRRVAGAVRDLVPAGEPVWAQVAPGNAASMRSVLASGFVPVAAEVLFREPRP